MVILRQHPLSIGVGIERWLNDATTFVTILI